MNSIQWLRISAAIFAASYFGALFTAPLPEGAYDDERVVALLSGGELTGIVVGGYALVVAGISALAFTSLLADTLRRTPGGGGASLVRALGTAYGLMVMVAAVAFLAVPMGHVTDELPAATASPFRELTMVGFVALLVAALLCAAVLVVIVSVQLRRAGTAPRWSTTTGLVIAPLLLVGAAWVPQFLVPLWALFVAFTVRHAPLSERRDEARPVAVG
jgi:hypothetical protein